MPARCLATAAPVRRSVAGKLVGTASTWLPFSGVVRGAYFSAVKVYCSWSLSSVLREGSLAPKMGKEDNDLGNGLEADAR